MDYTNKYDMIIGQALILLLGSDILSGEAGQNKSKIDVQSNKVKVIPLIEALQLLRCVAAVVSCLWKQEAGRGLCWPVSTAICSIFLCCCKLQLFL